MQNRIVGVNVNFHIWSKKWGGTSRLNSPRCASPCKRGLLLRLTIFNICVHLSRNSVQPVVARVVAYAIERIYVLLIERLSIPTNVLHLLPNRPAVLARHRVEEHVACLVAGSLRQISWGTVVIVVVYVAVHLLSSYLHVAV